jgi:O-antigen/teichoic acid export membrane protein
MVVDGTNSMLGAGLFIHRKTRVIMSIVLTGAAINIGLNLLLVSRMGIMGSAVATLVSYSTTALALCIAGRRLLPVPLPWLTFLRAGIAAAVMYICIKHVLPERRLLAAAVRPLIGAPIYAALMWFIDPDARAMLAKPLARLGKLVGREGGA